MKNEVTIASLQADLTETVSSLHMLCEMTLRVVPTQAECIKMTEEDGLDPVMGMLLSCVRMQIISCKKLVERIKMDNPDAEMQAELDKINAIVERSKQNAH